MFERLSDAARIVVVLSQEEARILNHDYIGTEHILLGLVHEGAEHATQQLFRGVTLEVARATIEDIAGRGSSTEPGHIPFTAGAEQVLERSLHEAFADNAKAIGPEHILLSLLRNPDGVALEALNRLDIDVARTRRELIESLHTAPHGDYLDSTDESGPFRVEVLVSVGGQPLVGVSGDYGEEALRRWAATELAIFQIADWDGPIWSTYSSAATTVDIGQIGNPTVALSQEILHERHDATGTSVSVISRRREDNDLERRANLSNLAAQVVKRTSVDIPSVDYNARIHHLEHRLHTGEIASTTTALKVDDSAVQFDVVEVGESWAAFADLDDFSIDLIGHQISFHDLEITRIANLPPPLDPHAEPGDP